MLQFCPDAPVADRQEAIEGLRGTRVRNALDELVDCAHSVGPHVLRGVVEHKVEHHVVQRLGQVHAYLAEGARDGVHELHCTPR